jgi:hypothetical protein
MFLLKRQATYEWEEDDYHQVLNFFHDRNGIAIVMGNN